jgi:hypothetical protein
MKLIKSTKEKASEMNSRVIGHIIGFIITGWYFKRIMSNIMDYTNESLLVEMAARNIDTAGILSVGFFLGLFGMVLLIGFGRCSYVLTTEFLNRNKKAAD